MKKLSLLIVLGLLLLAIPASAGHVNDPRTNNLHPVGHIVEPASLLFGPTDIHTDLAFWGSLAFQGNWDGFNIRDISAPGNPRTISRTFCDGNQGDIVVWQNVLVRSWNSPAPSGVFCDGHEVPAGFEGLHIFDISNRSDPALLGSVATACGSHTATAVPDPANNRLLVYNNGSSSACPWIEVVEVPLGNPAGASIINTVPLVGTTRCHDIGVILGNANLAACASGDAANVYDIGDNAFSGGSLDSPQFLYSIAEPGVGVGGSWHSASFTWDGRVVILGWEPGGGVAPECEASDPDVKKSAFFYNAATGAKLGQWTLPRPQSAVENCTVHNYNVVPVRSGRYVLVSGNYQSGTSVVDFTDPAKPVEVAYSDPPPLVPTDIGGAWSSYWYNNFIYESDITEGLNIFRLSSDVAAGAIRLDHLNPQTQMFTLP